MVVWYSTSETETEIVRLYGKTPSGMAEGVFYRLQFPDTAKCSALDLFSHSPIVTDRRKTGTEAFPTKAGKCNCNQTPGRQENG